MLMSGGCLAAALRLLLLRCLEYDPLLTFIRSSCRCSLRRVLSLTLSAALARSEASCGCASCSARRLASRCLRRAFASSTLPLRSLVRAPYGRGLTACVSALMHCLIESSQCGRFTAAALGLACLR